MVSFSQSYGTYFWAKNYIKSPTYMFGRDTVALWKKSGKNASITLTGGALNVTSTNFNVASISTFTIGTYHDDFIVYDPDVSTNAMVVHGDSKEILFDTDNGGYQVGINLSTANYTLDVDGDAKFTSFVLHQGIYGEIYGTGNDQTIPAGSTPTKITCFDTNGLNANTVPNSTYNKITVTKPGKYVCTVSLSYASGTNAVNWIGYIFVNGSEWPSIHSTGKTLTANDRRSTALSGIINVTSANLDVDFRVSHDNASTVDIFIDYINMHLEYIGN